MTASTPDLAALEAEMRARALEAPGGSMSIAQDRLLAEEDGGAYEIAFLTPVPRSPPTSARALRFRRTCEFYISARANVIAVLDGKDAEIARLTEKLNNVRENEADAAAFLEAAEARIAELEEALRPFAEAAEAWDLKWDDDTCVDEEGFCLGTLRRAAASCPPTARARQSATEAP